MNIAATAINLLLDSSPLFSSSQNAGSNTAGPLNLLGDVSSLLGGSSSSQSNPLASMLALLGGAGADGAGSSLVGGLAGSIAGILA